MKNEKQQLTPKPVCIAKENKSIFDVKIIHYNVHKCVYCGKKMYLYLN